MATSTMERLRVAGTAGTLDPNLATTLEEAFELFSGLRLEHQVEQIRRGVEPDNYIDPDGAEPPHPPLSPRRVQRRSRGVQRRLRGKLSGETTFG